MTPQEGTEEVAQLTHSVNGLIAGINAATDLVAAGHVVDLSELGERTTSTCLHIQSLDKEIAKPLVTPLQDLVTAFDRLQDAVTAAVAIGSDHSPTAG